MKVLLINGSPHSKGNTYIALSEIVKTLNQEDVEAEIVSIGTQAIHGCIACGSCRETGICVFKDEKYSLIREKLKGADGLIIGSPVYFSGPNGALCALLDRVFYSCRSDLLYKPAASVVVCRRGGASAAFDRLNKYFTLLNMPIVSSQYWNSVHGGSQGEASQDVEGLQTMRVLAKNMAWLLKKIHQNKEQYPELEPRIYTNFIR